MPDKGPVSVWKYAKLDKEFVFEMLTNFLSNKNKENIYVLKWWVNVAGTLKIYLFFNLLSWEWYISGMPLNNHFNHRPDSTGVQVY